MPEYFRKENKIKEDKIMGFRIQNNIAAMNAQRNLGISDTGLSKSLERLSSGYRINSAKDDAAGLAVSSGMRADIASYKVASRNVSEANSLLQVAEGGYDQVSNILNRMKELTTQGTSANASTNLTDIQNEITSLKNEINRIAGSTEYNGTALLGGYGAAIDFTAGGTSGKYDTATAMSTAYVSGISGNGVSAAATYTVAQVNNVVTITNSVTSGTESVTLTADGAQTVNFASQGVQINLAAGYTRATGNLDGGIQFSVNGGTFVIGNQNSNDSKLTVSIDKVSTVALGISGVTGTTLADLNSINTAIDNLASSRAKIGAAMNQLGYASANLSTTIENTQAAESVIRDVDMAAEMTNFTKNQILVQAGTAMLAQANSAPQQVLSLFK
jgi:flagellin